MDGYRPGIVLICAHGIWLSSIALVTNIIIVLCYLASVAALDFVLSVPGFQRGPAHVSGVALSFASNILCLEIARRSANRRGRFTAIMTFQCVCVAAKLVLIFKGGGKAPCSNWLFLLAEWSLLPSIAAGASLICIAVDEQCRECRQDQVGPDTAIGRKVGVMECNEGVCV